MGEWNNPTRAGRTEDSPDDWWQTFHTPEMADLFLERGDDPDLPETVDFLMSVLQLTDSSRVLDQCCGVGCLSLALARRNVHVVGCDLCSLYVDRAQRTAQADGTAEIAQFVCADAFQFVASPRCDAAFNWYSSFGYSEDDARNQHMVQRAADSLRPGGRYALDVPNFANLFRTFQSEMVHEGESQGRSVQLTRRSTLDFAVGMLRQCWRWEVAGEPVVEHQSALRMYLPDQIVTLLQGGGFEDLQLFGGYQGQAFTLESPRLIVVGVRR